MDRQTKSQRTLSWEHTGDIVLLAVQHDVIRNPPEPEGPNII